SWSHNSSSIKFLLGPTIPPRSNSSLVPQFLLDQILSYILPRPAQLVTGQIVHFFLLIIPSMAAAAGSGRALAAVALVLVASAAILLRRSEAIGVNWGTQLSHPLPASTVVRLLQDNGFDKVKLFDAEDSILSALKGSGIQVMVGIPNDMLADLAAGGKAADDWVAKNVSGHVRDGVDIRYVAVGNLPEHDVPGDAEHPFFPREGGARRQSESHRPSQRRRVPVADGEALRRRLPQ
ncbi:unnamed protein product, partial [Urochloa humidicola]